MRCISFSTLFLAASISTAVARPNLEPRKNVDRPDPANLDHCPGRPKGDADACTFEKQSDLPDRRRYFIVGKPVENCDAGNTSVPDIITTISDDRTITETWEHTDSVGIDLLGIKIGGTAGWSESTSTTQHQDVRITVPKGRKTAATVGVMHHESQGRIRINYGDPSGDPGKNDYHYIWYQNDIVSSQPNPNDVIRDSKEVGCNEDFGLE
ncbi:hypothetical protein FB451DRAFT_1247362 [Mycena latifolia]|nr:hypothetical protein FB451DRAFT_1247362 [Mycena latifolia]